MTSSPDTAVGPAAPADRTLDAVLAERWRSAPDAPVVLTDHERIPAADLHARALRVAGALRGHAGDRPRGDLRVAVYVERSADLVTALAGAVFASACQLALDPEDPIARTEFMIGDFRPEVLVTSRALADRLEAVRGVATLVVIDELPDAVPAAAPTPRPGDPDAPLYAVYTSGSSGRPKASIITHRSLLNCLAWLQETFALGADDRVLYRTACGFDVSVAELYWPLVSGAAVVVPSADRSRDAEYLAEVVARQRVTTLHFVPSLLEMFLLALPEDAKLDSVRRVLAGGEALLPALVRRFHARVSAQLWNMYGPSECTIYTTAWRCDADVDDEAGVPIGRPVRGARCVVLDDEGAPVPDGEIGELFVGGAGLALGYWRRPELTADRFRPDPRDAGRRLYASGDLVRRRPDGVLEYLGRADQQVKIRGYRIELGEIEGVLNECKGVRQAAAVAVKRAGTTLLVGFVGIDGSELPDEEAELSELLRESAAERLPSYMVPYRITRLEDFPLTPNGKLDRAALTVRAAELLGEPVASQPPEQQPACVDDPLRTAIADVWCEVLGVASLPPTADFFALGGDSLAAVRVSRALRTRIKAPVQARTLFNAPVLDDFVAKVAAL